MKDISKVSVSLNYLKHYYQKGDYGKDPKNLQINIRMNERLLSDIDFISEMLNVDRSEWMRVELAKAVNKAMSERHTFSFRSLKEMYVTGEIDEEHYEIVAGIPPSKELISERKKEAEFVKKSTLKTKEYLRGMRK